MVQTSARLLKLLSLLQSRRFWSGADLADGLGVTARSVRRDIERLRGLGYPVHAAAGVGGGYELGAGKELPPLPLDDEEAVAVAIGLRAAAAGPVKGVEAASLRALSKLEQVLPKRLRRRVNALQTVSVRLGDAGPTIDAETLIVLANACRDSDLVRFEYLSHDGAATVRHVEPYRLVHTSYRWYLLAWDVDRADWRTFRVDRIGVKPRPGQAFSPRPLPSADVAAYVAKSMSTHIQRTRARVTLLAPMAVASKRLSWIRGTLAPLGNDRCVLDFTADGVDSIAIALVFLGIEFEVQEPAELHAALQVIADRLERSIARSHVQSG